MQYLKFLVLICISCLSCESDQSNTARGEDYVEALAETRATYAPDRRTERVEVEAINRNDSIILRGYTTVPEARELLRKLTRNDERLVDSIRLLTPADRTDSYGLIRVSVANIRTEPGHSQELTSQALMGTPIQLLDEQEGWYLIRTPDRYLAWLEEGAVTRLDQNAISDWFNGALSTCVPAQSIVMTKPADGRIVSELVAGNILRRTGQSRAEYTEVSLPDGRQGWVPSAHLAPYSSFASPTEVSTDAVLETAFAQVGKPYLWGGTSPKAMDCSGFTKTAYYLNGYVIPRDASQQVHAGSEVPLDDNFSQLQRGDLLFFGTHRADGSERITHVGFYLRDGRFLHAGADNDYITENSLVQSDPDYSEHRRTSLLRARRLTEGTEGVVPVGRAFRALYTRSSSR